jgi:fluoride exporter
MQRFLIVCGAGGLGSGVRYLVSLWAGDKPGEGFPWGTLIVNVIGSFLIAVVLELALRKVLPATLSLALATGFMGGFTTYSSFNYQTTALAHNGEMLRAAINIVVTLGGALVAGLFGLWLARKIA